MKKITEKQRLMKDKHQGILALYVSAKYTTEQIAKNYNLSVREVQRIAKKAGVIRSQAEANRVAAPLKHYHTIPAELRVKRKGLTLKVRYQTIMGHPYCVTCGMRPDDGVRLEVDHMDEDATNNDPANLQVLCTKCNQGKSHVARFKG